jgi:hypothetical protein
MSKAIEQNVDAYVRLGNRHALEDLRTQRHRLAVDLKGRTGYDFSLPIGQINDEIAVIEAGLDRLNAAHSTEREGTWGSSSEVTQTAATYRMPVNAFGSNSAAR